MGKGKGDIKHLVFLDNDIQLQKLGWMKKGEPPPGNIVIYCRLIIMTGCNCY